VRKPRAPLFAINPWPPLADALSLALAVLVVFALAAGIAHASMAGRLHARDAELSREKDARTRMEARLRALAPAGTLIVEDGKVILQGEVLFRSGSDQLSDAGARTVVALAPALDQLLVSEPDQMVLFGGHTDDVPIANDRFSSNWELSTARATAVGRAFVEAGLSPARIIASGFGPHHPRGDNHTPEGRAANRRIEILLVPLHAVASR
jgi:flagellar motor protein MotB